MTNLGELSNNRLNSKVILRILLIVSLVGVIDTAYLTADHYLGAGVKCLILEGCEVVLTSTYSVIMGVPLALLGLIFYIAIFTLVNLIDIYGDKLLPKIMAGAGTIGFVASLYFLYLQVFVIRALCIYCLTSLASSTAIFILSIMVYRRPAKDNLNVTS